MLSNEVQYYYPDLRFTLVPVNQGKLKISYSDKGLEKI